VYQKFNDAMEVEKAWLYVSMRRGGRILYAFDVTSPSAPKLMWRLTSTDIPVLGQTWSEPRVARVKGYRVARARARRGLRRGRRGRAARGVATTMGNAVLVLDAENGTLIKKFDTARSVAASVALLDTDFDGITDRAYAADTGGSVYRIDFETADGGGAISGWRISNFAQLDGGAGRKFLHAADVVHTNAFTAVMIGSGNRERPLATATTDRFYTLFDHGVRKGTIPSLVIGDSILLPLSADFTVTGDHAGLLHGARPRREGRHVGGDDRRQHLLQHQPADAAGAEQLQHQPRRREGLPDPAVLRPSRLDRVRGRWYSRLRR
jgi:type IV pilus assembly protein PilY1